MPDDCRSAADDGKLFQGSGVGDAFGPRCFEGDVMGCGIMFPRDYTLEGERQFVAAATATLQGYESRLHVKAMWQPSW